MKKRQRTGNRKAQVRIPFPVVLANFLVFVAVFGLSYVWLCARCDTLGQEIKRLESAQRDTRRLLNNEQDRWSSQTSPGSLERALKHHKLAMRLPDEQQIVRVRNGAASSVAALAYNK
ncbi:MAG: hypothetical protein HOO88_02690 [Kiritimatiellaceae bacterium]|nr:hypothetical protein [Kiritimatiellaceae bacterium]